MSKALVVGLMMLMSVSAFASNSTESTSTTTQVEGSRADKSFLFRIEPHWLVFKELKFDFQFKVADHWTLGPTVAYMSQGDGVFYGTSVSNHLFLSDKTNRESLGFRTVYYWNGVERSGVFISGSGRYSRNHVKVSSSSSLFGSDYNRTGEFNETALGVACGYQWNIARLLTFNVGGGIGAYMHPDKFTLNASDGSTSNYDTDASLVSYSFDAGLGFNF